MTDIETLGYPLVYKAGVGEDLPPGLAMKEEEIAIRAEFRALKGMQKEALIYYGPTGTKWRMVSDEGPYLNGTDLAPFPLAFYTTGMALSFTDEFLKHAGSSGITIKSYQLTQDNFYTMEGSAIRGDMIGGALPVEMQVEIVTDADEATVHRIINLALHTSPAQVYMNVPLNNTFSLNHNGSVVTVTSVTPCSQSITNDPTLLLEGAQPLSHDSYVPDIITKLEAAKSILGIEGGAGSSLQATQKRTLHVRGTCTLRQDELKEVKVQLFKPLGSTFRFISDNTPQERAPASLAYLAAGIGFCYMTQIGRYAHITKQELQAYSVVQDTIYKINADSAQAAPVETHTFLRSNETDETAQQTLFMSERTCFLHAAMRGSNKTKISLTLNGEKIED